MEIPIGVITGIIGIPLFSGFVSKWMIANALFLNGSRLAKLGVWALMYSALMTAVYLFTIAIRAFFPQRGSNSSEVAVFTDPNWCMTVPLIIFSLVTIVFGVHSQQILGLLEKVSQGLL